MKPEIPVVQSTRTAKLARTVKFQGLTILLALSSLSCRQEANQSNMLAGQGKNSGQSEDGVFMSYASDATPENFKIISDAGFGKLFFHVAGRGDFSWNDSTFNQTGSGKETLKKVFNEAKTAGLKVVLWIEHGPFIGRYSKLADEKLKKLGNYYDCQEDSLDYLDLENSEVQDIFVRDYIGEVAAFAQEAGLNTIHIDDKFRLPGSCPKATFAALNATVKRIQNELGVTIDFSHLPLEYSKRAFQTDWTLFGLPKSLTTIQTYVHETFQRDATHAKSQGLGGIILSAGAGQKMTPAQAAENYKWIKSNTSLAAHIFSFHSLFRGPDSQQVKKQKVMQFFNSVQLTSSATGNMNSGSSSTGNASSDSSRPQQAPECRPITSDGQDAIRSCLNDSPAYMFTKTIDGQNYVPLFENLPNQGSRPLDLGLNSKVTVIRLKTCFVSAVGKHFSEVKIFDTSETSIDSSKTYWIGLQNLSCGKS